MAAQQVDLGATTIITSIDSIDDDSAATATEVTLNLQSVEQSERKKKFKRHVQQTAKYAANDSDSGGGSIYQSNSSDSDSDSENDYNNKDYEVCTVSSSSDSNDSNYDVSDCESNIDGDDDKDDSEECHLQLLDQGLDEHLKSPICNKSTAMTQTMMMRYTRFLVWLWNVIGVSTTVTGGFNVCQLISSFITQHSQLLPKYYSHLKEAYLFKASTIIDHNEQFQVLVHWYAIYRVRKDCFVVDPSQLYTINLIIKSMRKTFSRERKVQEAKSTDNTIEGLVLSRKWPKGGLQELSDAVVSQMDWARRLCVKGCVISLSIYNLFMQVFMSSLFTSESIYI